MKEKMGSYRIAALPGDGIGPEVLESSLQVLNHVIATTSGLDLQITSYEAGANLYLKSGETLPKHVLDACLDADAVLLAAIGLPTVRKSDGTEVQPEMMMGLRRALNVYAAVRPVKLYPGITGPLRTAEAGIDMVIIRENLEGLFASFGGGCVLNDQVATDTIVITREGTRRVADFAFRLARRRKGRPLDGQRMVTCVDKANVFRSFAFFRKVFFEVAAQYPDVLADAAYVDAMSLYMVQNPSSYDILVMENQFGDILSDLGAGIVGGLGLGPSAEIGDEHAMFQPSHGTAPQLAGKNVANPIAMILSASMMLDWLAEWHADAAAEKAGQRIENAVAKLLFEGKTLTADLGGKAKTTEVTEALLSLLKNN